MKNACARLVWTIGLMSASVGAMAEDAMPRPSQEPAETQSAASHDAAATVLDGLQGDVFFRTGSAAITAQMAQSIDTLAQAVAKSSNLKVRLDGYADARGSVDTNLKLSEDRANAVRDVFIAAGVGEDALEINAYGKSQSVARDNDGYALERRVRLTLQADSAAAVAQND